MYRKELAYYFTTPVAYIVMGLYLVGISLFLWVIHGEWNIVDSGFAEADGLFGLSPWLMMLLCPALTMRLFAEERQAGTWELLCAQPISLTRIVLAKYFAAWTITVISLLPCIVHYIVLYQIAEPVGNVDGGAFAGSMVGLLLLSSVFTAVGMLASTWTKSQIVAFVTGAIINFALYWVTLKDHYTSIARGVIDLRDFIWLISMAAAALILAEFIIGKITHK